MSNIVFYIKAFRFSIGPTEESSAPSVHPLLYNSRLKANHFTNDSTSGHSSRLHNKLQIIFADDINSLILLLSVKKKDYAG